MPRSKLKLSFIANKKLRKTSFMRRKTGIMKKLNEITTLCDVQACAVIYSPYTPVPEVWPSNQGAQEVTSRFMEVPEIERNKNMVDHTTYLQAKIAKEKEKLEKLTQENHASQLRQSMFDCLKGKINTYQYKLPDLQNLSSYIQNYINLLRARAEYLTTNGESSSFVPPYLTANGESSSSLPPLLAVVATVNPSVVADTALITAPVGFFDLIPYQNMNMNQNQHESVQHHVLAAGMGDDPIVVKDSAVVTDPIGFYDHTQYQNVNQNEHQPGQHYVPSGLNDQVEYQVPMNLTDQMQHGISCTNLNFDLSLNPNLHSDQYPNQQQIFMDPLMRHPQQMGYVGEHVSIPFMDGNNYNYHQLATVDLATTSHMPTITTTATNAFAP